ncbi:protein MMS22-like [Daktulosphaira vitifoliae]|uniref:protein MMS22-like n=1 Tax=Daktulosphaira vitifoliae TaxID=58002 RepID=UPI0021AA6BE1|nr:protein MMS22-like [Daktulosphaira vitifoliae]
MKPLTDKHETNNGEYSLYFDCKIHPNKCFMKSEIKYISPPKCEDDKINLSDTITLFGYSFNRGHSLVYDIPVLMKMAKKELLSLSTILRDQFKSFRFHDQNLKKIEFMDSRKQIVEFFMYLRDGFIKANQIEKYNWLIVLYEDTILLELENICSILGPFYDISENVIQHSFFSAESKNNIYYHLYHCSLEIQWLRLVILMQFNKHKEVLKDTISVILNDSVQLARTRFKKLKLKEVYLTSALLCECSFDFLILIQQLIEIQKSVHNFGNFWKFLNAAIINVNTIDNEELIFQLWYLSSLVGTHPSSFDINESNLNVTLKLLLNQEPNEAQLKLSICLLEKVILNSCVTDLIVTLWEYFHKKLNSMFYSSDLNIQSIACISKNGSELLVQMSNLFETQSSQIYSSFNSYQLFQRLLGLHLRNIKHNSKDWNQIKGRIFSKFSLSKLLSFNDIGFYNFTTLFLTLATMSSDTSNIALKYQHLINLMSEQKLPSNIRSIYWKGTIAFLILHSKLGIMITPYGSVLSEVLNFTSREYLNIFISGIKEVLIYNDSFNLGHHSIFGPWLGQYLNTIEPLEENEMLQSSLVILNKLKETTNNLMPLPLDNEIFLLYHVLNSQMLPFLKKSCSIADCDIVIADIGAAFTVLSVFPAFSNTKVLLFNFFVVNQGISIKLLNRYLSIIIKEEVITKVYGYNSLSLIKAWLHSSMLITNWTFNETITITKFISNIKEIQELYDNTNINLYTSVDPFISFLDQLHFKYHQIQDPKLRQKLCEKVADYFFSINIWVNNLVKQQNQNDEIYRLYMIIGYLLEKISPMIYVKSKPNTILQDLLEIMLLGVSVRTPNSKTHPSVITALQTNFHRYLIGLFKLNPKTDQYIARCLRELVSIYLPKILAGIKMSDELPLIKLFEDKPDSEIIERGMLLELIVTVFLNKRSRTPDSNVSQVLEYINKLIIVCCDNNLVIVSITHYTFTRICSVMMFCEDSNICKRISNNILSNLINMSISDASNKIKDEILFSLDALCQEHLAFSSKLVFDFFDEIIDISSNIVTCFLPKLIHNIEKVEWKRGIGTDFTLRKGLERIQTKLANM